VSPAGTIQWTAVPNAQKYYVYVGSTPGASDLIDSQEICNTCVSSPMATSWSLANAGKSPAQGLGAKAGQTVYLRAHPGPRSTACARSLRRAASTKTSSETHPAKAGLQRTPSAAVDTRTHRPIRASRDTLAIKTTVVVNVAM
jgi:hypothetical protein